MSTWEKAFDTFQWENRSQSTNTPLDATHLNKVNDALDVIDDRVIELQSADADMEEEIAGKQDALTFDDVPMDGSNNPVKSNGIYDALNSKVDKNGTDRLMTADEGTKLTGIAAGAQVNVLEGVQVNGSDLPITNKKVNVDISGKADKVTNATAGHLAGLDSNGNLTDSGVSPTEEVTVEGNPVTFESPFEQDAKSVVISVKPIQDLHGYDHPWVGGAGKNKLPLVLADIKANNTSGTWSGNKYTLSNVEFDVKTDSADNIIGIGINTLSATTEDVNFYILSTPLTISAGNYASLIADSIISGLTLQIRKDTFGGSEIMGNATNTSRTATLSQSENIVSRIKITSGASIANATVYPMLAISNTAMTSADFAPYSNICPISGIDEVEIEVSDGESEPTTTTIPLPSTLYGGTVDVDTGVVTVTDGYIASYDGETLPGEWISSIDEYVAGTTPSTGAQVAYKLATPTTLSFTPTDVELLEGTNVVTTNGEKVAVTYGRSFWQDIDKLKTDTEGKLNKSDVADVEGDTASRAYSVNEFMLRSDGLYKVTQPIAQNASITSSNTTKTTIGAVLTALLNA